MKKIFPSSKGRLLIIFFFLLVFIFADISSAQEKLTLANGLTLVLEERKALPLVYLHLWVKTGSIYEGQYLGSGISHFLEHMLFKDGEGSKRGKVAQKVRSLGGRVNAYTFFDHTVYHIMLPASAWTEGLGALSEAVFNAPLEEKEIEKERVVILREMDLREDEPQRFLSQIFWENFYQVHPYRFPIIGKRELFNQLTRQDLVDFYRKVYVPNNMILVICGDIEIPEAKKEVEKFMGQISPKPLQPTVLPEEPPQLHKREKVVKKDLRMTYLQMGFHIPPLHHKDIYALDILAVILGKGKSSRLYSRLKGKESLVYSISAYSYTPLYEGIFSIYADMNLENLTEVKKGIWEEVKKVKRKGILTHELSKAKEIIFMQELSNQETLEGRASELASNEALTGDLEFTRVYLSKIKKVTNEEVRRVANKYLNNENCTAVSLVPSPERNIHLLVPSLLSFLEEGVQKERHLLLQLTFFSKVSQSAFYF